MRGIKVRSTWSIVVTCVTLSACLFPDEVSNQLSVQLDPLPALFEGDQVGLVASLLDQSGAAVPNAALSFTSSDPTIASVSPDGAVTAVKPGTATITVAAVGFERAQSASLDLTVHALVEIDSIVPAIARFGQEVTIYGAGLDSIFQVTFGNVAAYITGFTPDDVDAPERFGQLTALVMPPSPLVSLVQVTSFRGVSIAQQTLTVVQRDILEPNDTTPQPLPFPFASPAMAFEPPIRQNRTGLAFDWYTVNIPAASDVTLYITSSVFLPGSGFTVYMADDVTWTPGSGYGFAASNWVVSSGVNKCGGTWSGWGADPIPFEEPARFHMSLGSVPAGTYHLLLDYRESNIASPGAYILAALDTYTSVRPRDRAEENDFCGAAAPLWANLAA
ncbi:MAG: Ig-like domain-containing protein, partial [Gemmatimonadota bacterium]|nr:Ig-like domain-containing protein [Gemmatimonadota bacterium]